MNEERASGHEQSAGTVGGVAATDRPLVLEGADRFNGSLFFASYILIYLAAPVTYVGVVQAALVDKLGASAAVANLPASAYLFGFTAPFIGSWLIPHRWEQRTLVICTGLSASLLAFAGVMLLLPVGTFVHIAAVVGHGCIMGFTASLSQVFMLQCLARGTTSAGRARAFKLAFGAGPVAAVIGSLTAQHMLAGDSWLGFPNDFAALYLGGFPCMAAVSLLSSRYRLVHLPDERRPSFRAHLARLRRAFGEGSFRTTWVSYFLFFSTLAVMPNLSLRTNAALGREPREVAGAILALRFGTKSLAGFLLGMLALRKGAKAPMLVTALLLAFALVWAASVPGWPYLFTFGLIGAGELGGAYFPNYLIAISTLASNPRNQGVLVLAIPAASVAPVLHGYLTDAVGFSASLLLAGLTIALSLLLIVRLPSPREGTPVRR